MSGRIFRSFSTLGAIASSILSLWSCCTGEPPPLYVRTRNESSAFFGIVFESLRPNANGYFENVMENVMLDVGEEDQGIYELSPMTLRYDFKFSLVTLDSVIEVRLVFSSLQSEPPFELLNHAGDGEDGKFLYIFTDTYMSELADSMRARGRKPYDIGHEYVVNSTRQDFTLRCVSPGMTWEYEIVNGDSAEIERRWLMERAGIGGGHYEFVFKDSTFVAWPADKRYYQLQGYTWATTCPLAATSTSR